MPPPKLKQTLGDGNFGMGSEREYSLRIMPRDKNALGIDQFEESPIIDRMIRIIAERSGAVSFGLKRNDFLQQSLDPILLDPELTPEEKELIRESLERETLSPGIYLKEFGRIYEEGLGKYFECSTVPCRDPFELLKRIRQGEQIAGFAARHAATDKYTVACFNAGCDRRGSFSKSAGHHINLWTWRENFKQIYRGEPLAGTQFSPRGTDFASILVCRLPLTGAGRIYYEPGSQEAYYEISERAGFITHPISSNTAGDRPLLNTRDEPHCSEARVHQINNDGNRSPWSILINLCLQALGLNALAHDGLILSWRLEDPVRAIRRLSQDINLSQDIPIVHKKNGRRDSRKPLELLLDILKSLERYLKISPLPPWCTLILGEALELTERMKMGDFDKASRMLDWLIKPRYLAGFKNRSLKTNPCKEVTWAHPGIQKAELGYHLLDDERMWIRIAESCRVRDFEKYHAPYGDPETPAFWKTGVPTDTRAYLFWYLLSQPELKSRIAISDWEYFVFRENVNSKKIKIVIADLFRFNQEHLEMILRDGLAPLEIYPEKTVGENSPAIKNFSPDSSRSASLTGFDFTNPEGRARFMERLQEEGKPYEPPLSNHRGSAIKRASIPAPAKARCSTLERRAGIAEQSRRLLPIVSQAIDDYQEGFRLIEVPTDDALVERPADGPLRSSESEASEARSERPDPEPSEMFVITQKTAEREGKPLKSTVKRPSHLMPRSPLTPIPSHEEWIKRVCRKYDNATTPQNNPPQFREPGDIYERSLGNLEPV